MIRGAGYKDTRLTEKQIQAIRAPTLALIGAMTIAVGGAMYRVSVRRHD